VNSVGAIIVACFAVLWVAAGGSNSSRRSFGSLLVLTMLISAAVVVAATRIPLATHSAGFNGKIYGLFVALEAVAIAVAVVLISRLGAKQYLMPVIAFIVGAHFFGMVPALQMGRVLVGRRRNVRLVPAGDICFAIKDLDTGRGNWVRSDFVVVCAWCILLSGFGASR
jgi:hypothetical protein